MTKDKRTHIGFNEALKRIAHTPKSVIHKGQHTGVEKVNERVYNDVNGAIEKPPQPAKRRR